MNMISRCLIVILLLVPAILSAEVNYYGSFLFSAPTRSGNVVIWETKYPHPSQAVSGATIALEAVLYLVAQDKFLPLLDRKGEQVMADPYMLTIAEESSPDRIGTMLTATKESMYFALEVMQARANRTAKSMYRIELPNKAYPVCCCYLSSQKAWAFVLDPRHDPNEKDGAPEGRLLRIVRADGKLLSETPYSVPEGSSEVGMLLDAFGRHIAILMAQFRGIAQKAPPLHAVTFDLSNLSKSPSSRCLTDDHPLNADTLAFSRDKRYFAAFHIEKESKSSRASIWSLINGRATQIAGPTPVPDTLGNATEVRMAWSCPDDHLVFISCDGLKLNLAITDRRLKVVNKTSIACTGDLSLFASAGFWSYFDREDCLICQISNVPSSDVWLIVRCDFATNKTTVLKNATYGVDKMLENEKARRAKRKSRPTSGR